MVDEHHLNVELERLKALLPKDEWKYYHLQSVENFIYHLKTFKSERTRERMANEIESYINLVSEKMHEASAVHKKSKELFSSIWKLSDTYKYEVGFIQRPSYLVCFILLAALFLLLKFSLNTLEALGICFLVFGTYAVYGYFKIKARRVF